MRELVFCCGIEGSEAERADPFEQQVLAVIEQVATQGVSLERLEAVLHQLELHQREISGDSYPYGLQLILQALGCATHYSDPIAVLDLDPVIANMRSSISDPDYIRGLARNLLLHNNHRVTLVMSPDKTLSARRNAAEAERLAAIKASLEEERRAEVVRLAADLQRRQQQVDDESILPKVELADVPASVPELQFRESTRGPLVATRYGQGTNGLVYQQVISPLPSLSAAQVAALPHYTAVLTELGLGGDSYLETQHRQSATVGSINAFTSMRSGIDDEQAVNAYLVLSSKALLRNAHEQSRLMHETLHQVRFDETARIRDLVSQQRARREQAITGNGHGLAMAAACAGMSPLARLNHELSGLGGIRLVRELDERLREEGERREFADKLATLHEAMLRMPTQLLTIAEEHQVEDVATAALETWAENGTREPLPKFQPEPLRERCAQMWVGNTQVNFCARAYPTVTVQHPDAAPLTVLGGFLRNGYLHRSIREQGGAYGGGASQDSGIAGFRFYSYRDPRLEETLLDFDGAIAWMLEQKHEYRALEEAILGVIGSLDKPSSPAGEAKQHFHNRLFGRTHEQREQFRERILAVTLDDLRRVTQSYLRPELASTAVITNSTGKQATEALRERLGLSVEEL